MASYSCKSMAMDYGIRLNAHINKNVLLVCTKDEIVFIRHDSSDNTDVPISLNCILLLLIVANMNISYTRAMI